MESVGRIVLIFLVVWIELDFSRADPPLIVTTPLGRILGLHMTSTFGRDILSFRSVPYARPLVGQLRFSVSYWISISIYFFFSWIDRSVLFNLTCLLNTVYVQDPQPVDAWINILDGTRESPQCVQFSTVTQSVKGEENCLFLNIYTASIDEARPVMVWFHGGAFYMGSGTIKYNGFGPQYFLDRDIVLVTVNYRLGI